MINRNSFIKRCLVGSIGIAFDPLKNIPLLGSAIKKEVVGMVRPKTKKARLTPEDITREALKVLHKSMGTGKEVNGIMNKSKTYTSAELALSVKDFEKGGVLYEVNRKSWVKFADAIDSDETIGGSNG